MAVITRGQIDGCVAPRGSGTKEQADHSDRSGRLASIRSIAMRPLGIVAAHAITAMHSHSQNVGAWVAARRVSMIGIEA